MKIIKAGYEILSPINREEILKSIEIAGRTCYKSEDKITEDSASKFVKMLVNRGHEAMIEHYNLTVKFICDRGVSHEIVRHRIASYAQESTRYCLAGDTKLYTSNPHENLTIKELYNKKINSPNGSWKRIKIKQLNENSGLFDYINIKDIYFNGKQKTYKIKTKLGYELIATKEHEIFTDEGFKKVQDLFLGNKIGVNGVAIDLEKPLYQNKDWLLYHYNTLNKTSVDIENEFGFNRNTIKKWVKIHQLPLKPKSYWNVGREPWNKGLSEEDDERIFNQAEALRDYHWYGGNSNKVLPIKERIKKLSIHTYRKTQNNHCLLCNSQRDLQVHHIDENRENNDIENLFTLCKKCHMQIHNKNLKFLYFDEIISIIPFETTEVYDLSMNGEFKNYIANGIVVHNCNYSNDKFGNEITVIKPLFWDKTDTLYDLWVMQCSLAESAYFEMIDCGATPQEARSILPNSLKTEIVVTMNLREWRHFFKLRTAKVAHPQMREVAIPLLNELKEKLPEIFEDIIVED